MNSTLKVVAALGIFVAGIAFDALFLRLGPHEGEAAIVEDTSPVNTTVDGILVRRDPTLAAHKALYVTRHRLPFTVDIQEAPSGQGSLTGKLQMLPGVTDASREDDYSYIITKAITYKWDEVDPDVIRALNNYRPEE